VHAIIEFSPAVLFVNKLRNSSFRKARQKTEERGWTGEEHKPSLLLLLPLHDGISISKLITFKIQLKPSLPSAHPKPSLLLLPDGISIRKSITFKIQFKPSLLSANPKPSLLLLPDRISIRADPTIVLPFLQGFVIDSPLHICQKHFLVLPTTVFLQICNSLSICSQLILSFFFALYTAVRGFIFMKSISWEVNPRLM
jgi:hypothetical protein